MIDGGGKGLREGRRAASSPIGVYSGTGNFPQGCVLGKFLICVSAGRLPGISLHGWISAQAVRAS
jgi:hypothetical protein